MGNFSSCVKGSKPSRQPRFRSPPPPFATSGSNVFMHQQTIVVNEVPRYVPPRISPVAAPRPPATSGKRSNTANDQKTIRSTSVAADPVGHNKDQHVASIKPKPVAAAQHSARHTKAAAKTCGACGDTEHSATECRYANRKCYHCREDGHIMRVCPLRRPNQNANRYARKHNKVRPTKGVMLRTSPTWNSQTRR